MCDVVHTGGKFIQGGSDRMSFGGSGLREATPTCPRARKALLDPSSTASESEPRRSMHSRREGSQTLVTTGLIRGKSGRLSGVRRKNWLRWPAPPRRLTGARNPQLHPRYRRSNSDPGRRLKFDPASRLVLSQSEGTGWLGRNGRWISGYCIGTAKRYARLLARRGRHATWCGAICVTNRRHATSRALLG